MNRLSALPRRLRALPTSVTVGVAALGIAGLVAAGTAAASGSRGGPSVPAPPTNPTRADQIQNIDQVKTAIKGYYGDTTTPLAGAPAIDPVTTDGADTVLHYPSVGGAYDKEMGRVTKTALRYLAHPNGGGAAGTKAQKARKAQKAIVLDVDDTTLNTYNYEIYSNFVYNPAQNAAFVNSGAFPAVFHMVQLVNKAKAEGYTVFFLTGRPESQRTGTDANLTKVGYPVVDSQVYLKDLTKPIYSSCYVAAPTATNPSCTTIQYKSITRRYIESLGYDIVANFGDQYSDLKGGYADRGFKLPNPMYYLP
ncbi:HAD family acid phosphatase [uncultured Jatrophihabitans sp.]|uniref:HAD family acid phosphatase n=1 Tax=uncultured Jatrophihabitans sp. TaxID=1610747 RepID=UPI0035CBB511